MTTRAALITSVAKRLGAITGNVGTNAATSAVLPELINTTGDDNAYDGHRLIFPAAANEASKQTIISGWVDLTGAATFASRTATASEPYILLSRADYTLGEFRAALTEALTHSKRSYRYVIPAIPGEHFYNLAALDWLAGAGDVDAVYLSGSPNLLHNEDYGTWQQGADAAPDGWTLAGSGATIARSTASQRGGYAVTVTRVGNDCTLTQNLPPALVQYLTRGGGTLPILRAGQWVTASVASRARVGITSTAAGVTTVTYSSYHTGGSVPEWLEVSLQLTAAMTALGIVGAVGTGDTAATFSGAVLTTGDAAINDTLKHYGSGAYREQRVPKLVRNVGGAPVVELQSAPTGGQVIVYCRRQFADVATDSEIIDDQYARVLEAGLAVFLLQNIKPGVDRTRYDRVLKEETPIWTRALSTLTDLPVPAPLERVEVLPA
jgi:hypothetical protein